MTEALPFCVCGNPGRDGFTNDGHPGEYWVCVHCHKPTKLYLEARGPCPTK